MNVGSVQRSKKFFLANDAIKKRYFFFFYINDFDGRGERKKFDDLTQKIKTGYGSHQMRIIKHR